MHAFCEQLLEGLKRCDVVEKRLLVATSGGADSVALLRGLDEIAPSLSLELVVAHLNHRLRGPESDADAVWVNELAKSLNLTCEVGDLTEGSLDPGAGALEENARIARYRFLEEAAEKFGCSTIVVAHTADDLIETALLHLFRGTGIAGLCSIPPVRPLNAERRLVRPMLGTRRSLVEQYLQDRQQSFRVDSTNSETWQTRNRIRHVVLPMLREQVNAQVDVAIIRLVEQAVEVGQLVSLSASRLLDAVLKNAEADCCHVDVRPLEDQPRHLVREVFRELWQRQGWPLQAMGFEQWNRLEKTVTSRATIMLPGQVEVRFQTASLLVLRCR